MKKLFVGSLPTTATEESVEALFSQYGRVHSLKLIKDMFSGQCKGFGTFEMEGHEARAVIAALNGQLFEGNHLKVNYESPRGKGFKGGRR
ncbi:MAG: RNA-binding protein [Gammaproteobacteria bacterium]|nr:RNA-binding protein [Gammaproteobacteria bacterium]